MNEPYLILYSKEQDQFHIESAKENAEKPKNGFEEIAHFDSYAEAMENLDFFMKIRDLKIRAENSHGLQLLENHIFDLIKAYCEKRPLSRKEIIGSLEVCKMIMLEQAKFEAYGEGRIKPV